MARDGDLARVIKEAFEREKLSVDEIASAFSLEREMVELVLGMGSAEFRTRALLDGEDPERVYRIVEDEDFDRIKAAYKEMLLDHAESTPPAVRERGLRWLMQEKLGRNKVQRGIPGVTFNILRVNERLEELNARKERLLAAVAPPAAETTPAQTS